MQDKTLGELAAGLARYRAQLVPLLIVVVIALFFEGTGDSSAVDSAAAPLGSTAGAPQVGSASVPPALAGPTGGVADDLPDLSASGFNGLDGQAGEQPAGGADSPPPDDSGTPPPPDVQPFTCEQDASLPAPVVAPVMEQMRANLPPEIWTYVAGAANCSPGADPLSLVVAQLGTVLGAAGPVIDVMRTVNSMLPPIPVPPAIPLPGFPAELNPALVALYPVTGEACGQLATSVLLIAILANLPLPITGQHASAILAPVFNTCSSLTAPAVPPG